MANETMVLLEKIVVPSGGASSITFTSIPQSYTDLQIRSTIRSTRNGGFDTITIKFNGNLTNMSYLTLEGRGNSAASFSGSSVSYLGSSNGSTSTASTFSNLDVYIPNYTSSANKSYSVDSVAENNATGAFSAYQNLVAGLWSNSAAITSITISPDNGSFVQYSTFYLYGVAKQGVTPTNAPAATGGDSIVFDGTYWIHTFTSSGTFTPKKGLTCDYLVVAGGGGGGANSGGGGGAGGLRSTVTATGGGGSLESALSLAANTGYTVTVGGGGAGGVPSGVKAGVVGSNSVFSTITANGGGGGGGDEENGNSGGSGGGAGGGPVTAKTGGTGTSNQGFAGGNGFNSSGYYTGGGGGAGALGNNASGSNPGAGGNGVAVSISGSSVTYGGGGGGGAGSSAGASGGTGGGGAGSGPFPAGAPGTGTVNTGGGGGGCGNSATNSGGAGGSGIVIVRYAA